MEEKRRLHREHVEDIVSPRSQVSDSGMQTAVQSSQHSDIDPEGVVESIQQLLPLVSQPDSLHYSTSKRVKHLNELAKVIKYCGYVLNPYYPVEKVIESVRLSLVSSVKEVRAGALRVLRYLVQSKETLSIMLRLRIDILVVRSLDVPAAREIERLQAVRFVRQVISAAPSIFPTSLAAPLVSIVLYESDPLDNLTWSAIATLCELALVNPEAAAMSGGIKAILKGLLKSQILRISESIVLTLNYLLNRPDSRKYVRSQLDLESLLAPITDLHYRCTLEEANRQNELDMRVVQASKMAVVSMLKSWPGLFCLCSPHNTGLTSLLSMLPLTQSQIQREILDILYSVFQLQVPTWTDNFHEAIASVDPVKPKSEWTLTEGFVVEEGKDLLPPKYGSRTDLVDCFHALLLAVLIEEGLFEYLVEVVRTAQNHVRVMTTILMGQLLHMANTILPSEFSTDAHCLSDLIASAMDFDTYAERNRATEVISYLDRVHQQKKEGMKPSSLYLRLILEQARYTSQPQQDQELLKLIPNEMEDVSVLSLVRDTDVPNLSTKEYMKWKWNLIFSVLQHPSIRNQQVMEDANFGRFIKRLCNFFKPSGHLFSIIKFTEASQKMYSAVGKLLVKYLCCIEENFSSHLASLLTEIVHELSQVTASKVTADVFSASSISNKLARDYFIFLGTISFLRPGLLEQCGAYGPLNDICNYQNRSDLMKLILSTLDFGNIQCRVILSKILTSTDKEMRLYATRHMRVLLRAKMPFFNSWGLELLVPQLYDLDRRVALEAVEILDEACEEENFLEALLLQQPALLHLGDKGASVFTRFVSIRRGFSILQKLMVLESLVERSSTFTKLYVYIVEEKLAEALTSFKVLEEGQFVRRTNTSVIHPKAFVPVHFYGQVVQHEEGCAMLEKLGHVKKFCETIQQDTPTTKEEVTVFKAAIWALGHVGSTQQGLELLLNENAVEDLIELAEHCPMLSIRGTCYYSLCLISKTKAGANVLFDNNWITVQHSAEEKWPLTFDTQQELDDAGVPLSPDAYPIRFFPPLFGSFDLNSLPRRSGLPKASSYQVLTTTSPSSREHSRSLSSHSTLSLRRVIEPSSRRTPPPPSRFISVRKPGRKMFTSLKDKGRVSPSLSRLRVKSSADVTWMQANTLSHRSLGQSKQFSISTGELLSPDLHKASSPVSQYPPPQQQPLNRVTSLGQPHRSRASSAATFFIGVCIPIDISNMFEYPEEEYKGFRTRTSSAPNFDGQTLPHDPLKCMECSLNHRNLATSSLSSLQQNLLANNPQSCGSHTTDTSSTAGSGVGSFPSKDKSLDATPSPDVLNIQVRSSSQENITDGGESSDGGIGKETNNGDGGSAPTTTMTTGEPQSIEKRHVRGGSPLVHLKRVQSQETDEVRTEEGDEGEGGESAQNEENGGDKWVEGEELPVSQRLREVRQMNDKDGGEQKDMDSNVIRLTPVEHDYSKELSGERGDGEEGEEGEQGREGEGDEGMTTEDDETEDDELDDEEEGEGEVGEGEEEGDDSISPTKEILINVVSASSGTRAKKPSSIHAEGGGGGVGDDTVSVSSVMTTQSTDESGTALQALHKAVLEIVYSLSSDVSLKKNSQGLNQVCQKYTELGDDLCLYSKVVDMLSTYHYNLLTRRFIQSKFQHMTYEPLFSAKAALDETFTEEDLMSSAASSRRESYCSTEGGGMEGGKWRRRSSTSDMLRFRHRMRQASSHESHEEIHPNPVEGQTVSEEMGAKETVKTTRREPEITITAASISSQESGGGPDRSPIKQPPSSSSSSSDGKKIVSSSASSTAEVADNSLDQKQQQQQQQQQHAPSAKQDTMTTKFNGKSGTYADTETTSQQTSTNNNNKATQSPIENKTYDL